MNRLDTEFPVEGAQGHDGHAMPRCCHREHGSRYESYYGHEHEGCPVHGGNAVPRHSHREYGKPYESHYRHEHEGCPVHGGNAMPRRSHREYGKSYESYYGHEHRHEDRQDPLMSDFPPLYEDIDDIPCLDEIPTALILAGEIDEKSLMKAALKQQRKKALLSHDKKINVLDQQTKARNNRNGRKRNKNANLQMKKKHIELTNESNLDTEVWDSVTSTYDGIDEKCTPKGDQHNGTRKAKEFAPVETVPKVPNNADSRPHAKNHKRTRDTGGNKRFRTTETSILNGYSQLLGTSNENHSFDDYDRLDYTDAYVRDDEDIPYAMKLGNLEEAQSNFRRLVFYPDTNRRNQMVHPQSPTKNKNKLPSKNGRPEQDEAYTGDRHIAPDNKEEKTLTKEDRPPVYSMLPDDSESQAMPVKMLLIISPDVPKSSNTTLVTCEEIEVEDKNQVLVMNKAEEIKSGTALHAEECEVHSSAQKGSSNTSEEVKAKTEIAHGDPQPSPAPTLTLSTDVLKLADSRHVAFRKIQYKTLKGDIVKCTACRRPECSSQNIKRIKELIKAAEEEGYAIRDVPPDGNCMFAAVVDQLELHGEFAHTSKSLRDNAVHWLIENPHSSDGTHYESFIEEEWDKYLQRMMGEGQWGDHIVLRSIAQVLGRTIMVLNPGESDKRWTKIDVNSSADSEWNAKWVIFLGLAGEFHYTSLVPKEETLCSLKMDSLRMESMMSMTAEEMELFSLEGVEDVSMFHEDHIDPWSDLPLAHFSFILKKIVPISCLETAAYFKATYCEESDQVQPALTTIGTECPVLVKAAGDIADGVYVPLLNSSLATYISDLHIRQDLRVVEKTDPSRCVDDYCLDARGCHPGYTKIMVPTNIARAMKTFYMPHEDMEKDHESRIPGRIYRKQVPAIPCAWPLCAATWRDRPRREGWPSQPLIGSVVAGGCCLIGIPHKLSKTPKLEWQLSFSLAGRFLMREGISDNQKYCYILFKALCCQALEKSDMLTSDHFKQIFFYACERVPVEFWSSNLAACIVYMTDELMRCLRDRNLPNYFVPSNNMICYFSDQQLQNTANGLERLRAQPILYLQQIHNSLKAIRNGEHVIDIVIDDALSYKDHKSLRRSTLEAFVPASLELAKNYIKNNRYGEGFNMISQAYEERLAVSTCDDTVPFQIFLTGALGGLSENDLVWFSVYADKHFQGQIPISLISELSTTYSTVKINEILPDDITTGYGNSLVPSVNTRPLTSFCLEFAKFLYFCDKKQACLPVLYYCRDKYLEKTKQESSKEGKQTQEETDDHVSHEAMVEIYTAICRVYFEQRQVTFFDELVPELIQLCEKLNKKPYYSLLVGLGVNIGNTEMAQTATVCLVTAEEGESADVIRMSNAMQWPDGLSNRFLAQENLSSLTPSQLANSLMQYSL